MVEPYYADDLVTLYHGDCLDVGEWLRADLLLTDPPYGIAWSVRRHWTNRDGRGGHRSSGNATSIASDHDPTVRDKALDLWGEGRLALVFGDIRLHVPGHAVHTLIYHKPADAGIRGARAGVRKDVEAIYMLGPWPVTVGGRSSVFTTQGRVAGPRGMAFRAKHPHAKPIDVLEQLLSLAGGTVADPFAGSGSTLVAAKALGRRSIGVEVEERYCEIAAKRLAQDALDFDGAA